jgi:hypothetical protein
MKIAITTSGGGLAVMTIVNGADIAKCISDWKDVNQGEYVSHRILPDGCTFPPQSLRQYWTDNGTDIVVDDEYAKLLAQAKAAKLSEILSGADVALNAVASAYSEYEKLSWPKQEAEAQALALDPDAPAPLLRMISIVRGIPLAELSSKVLANVAASEQATGYVLGLQQGYEDAVKAATTVEAVQAIVVTYEFPGA